MPYVIKALTFFERAKGIIHNNDYYLQYNDSQYNIVKHYSTRESKIKLFKHREEV